MIPYNSSIFGEDPLHKFYFEDFHNDNETTTHLGYNPSNLDKKSQNKKQF